MSRPFRPYVAAFALCAASLCAVAWAGFGAAQGGGGGFKSSQGTSGGFGTAAGDAATVVTYTTPFPDPLDATTIIYVSDSDGDDADNGSTAELAKKTLSAALALVTSGTHTSVLLKRGDTFTGQTIDHSEAHSGLSATEPFSIAAYGSGARPVIQPTAAQNALSITGGDPTHFRLFQDLDIYWAERDPNHASYVGNGAGGGFYTLNGINTFLVLRCSFRFGKDVGLQDFNNLGFTGSIIFRECTFENCYDSSDDRASGIYIEAGDGDATPFSQLRLERCVFYFNGHNPDTTPVAPRTVFSHGLYFQNRASAAATSEPGGPVWIENCVFLYPAANGVQCRSGGTVKNNLFVRCPISILIGGGDTPVAGGVTGNVEGNMMLEGEDIDGAARAWGIDASNIQTAADSLTITNNRLASAINPSYGTTFAILDIASGVTYSGNVSHDWTTTPPKSDDYMTDASETYTRTLATFDSSVGGPGTEASAIANIVAHTPAYSTEALLTYFRAGF